MTTGLLVRALRELGELQAHLGATAVPSGFTAYRGPGGRERFAREVLRLPGVLRWQSEAWEQLDRGVTLVALRSANACGKSLFALATALYEVLVEEAIVLYGSASWRQNKTSGGRELRRILAHAPLVGGDLYGYGFVPDAGEGILYFFGGDASVSASQGYHGRKVVVLLDEFQGNEDGGLLEAALANIAGGDASSLIVCGNPLTWGTPFHMLFTKSTPGWWKRRVSASEVLADAEYQRIPGLVTKKWVETMRETYGTESSAFNARVEGEFPRTADDAMFPPEAVAAAFARWHDAAFRQREWNKRRRLGVDVAASAGGDESVIAVARGGYVEQLIAFREPDTMRTVGRIIDAFRALGIPVAPPVGPWFGDPLPSLGKPATIVIDEIGVGKGCADRLKEAGYRVSPFNASKRADEGNLDAPRYCNLKAEAFDTLRTKLVRGEVALPYDAMLEEELLVTRAFTNSSGRLQIVAKNEMRETLGRSPDRLDAVVLAVATDTVPTFEGLSSGAVAGI